MNRDIGTAAYLAYPMPEMADRTLEPFRLHNLRLNIGERVHAYNPNGPWAFTGIITEPTSFVAFQELIDGRWKTWMSTSPLEMASVGYSATKAYGQVLVGGLGLGMFAWIAAQRPEVASVTVFELEPKVIELVRPYLTDSKIYLIEDDIYNATGWGYDFVYLDIWRNAPDAFQDYGHAQAFMQQVGKPDATRMTWMGELVEAVRASEGRPVLGGGCAVCARRRPAESLGLVCDDCRNQGCR